MANSSNNDEKIQPAQTSVQIPNLQLNLESQNQSNEINTQIHSIQFSDNSSISKNNLQFEGGKTNGTEDNKEVNNNNNQEEEKNNQDNQNHTYDEPIINSNNNSATNNQIQPSISENNKSNSEEER